MLRAGVGIWRALDALVLHPHEDALVYSPFLIIIVVSTLVTVQSAYLAFIKYPEVLVTIFHLLFDHNGISESKKTWTNMTIQEVAVLVSPWNILVVAVMYVAIVLLYPFAPFSLNLILPNILRTKLTVGIGCVMEMIYAAFMTATLMFVCLVLLCFFQKCMEEGRHLRATVKIL